MTLKDILITSSNMLKTANIETPAVDAGVIICHVIKKDKAFLYAHGEYELSQKDEKQILSLVERRLKGEPVQYLIGSQEFMGLDFTVNNHVLIPRHDTEILVETVIKYAEEMSAASRTGNINILDIGTGSGCIAVSLAYYIPFCRITAVDISIKALEVAGNNSRNNCVDNRINFIQSDIFSNLKREGIKPESFDIIVSNPPYIPLSDMDNLQIEVRGYEPLNALEGGKDGLDFYRKITSECIEFMKSECMLVFEVGYGQASDVADIMKKNFGNIKVIKDLSGIDRVVAGIRV